MIFCSRDACAREAKWAPKICVPATGYPAGSHEPLACILGFPVCTYHVAELKPETFLDPETEGGQALRTAFETVSAGRAPPDFARAYVARVSLNSPEYRIFERKGGAA